MFQKSLLTCIKLVELLLIGMHNYYDIIDYEEQLQVL